MFEVNADASSKVSCQFFNVFSDVIIVLLMDNECQ